MKDSRDIKIEALSDAYDEASFTIEGLMTSLDNILHLINKGRASEAVKYLEQIIEENED